ncbi:transmembrane protein 245 isoform X2 [Chelonus insularis]|uniref:transmembrane protein 245 isoform X2 n=1 Tax=Chelonus insularis TaxID=460826 RepID=UPI00158A0431|nr:transmembrane protein 245 isoform X2 [Chelonus insularis]
MELPRTPMDNLMNVLSGFSIGHEKALKQGVYNAVALLLLCLVCTATYGLYIILQPFVKPLIWALLCGSVLFPFKFYITNTVNSWFAETESSHEPLLVNFAMVPIKIMDRISEGIGSFLYGHLKYVGIALASAGVAFLVYSYTPSVLICLIWRFIQLGIAFVTFFVVNCNIYVMFIVVIGYMSIFYIYWTPSNGISFNYASLVIWIMFSLYISNIFGMYQIAIFCLLQILCITGFVYEVILIMDHKETQGKPLTFAEAVQLALTGDDASNSDAKISETVEEEEDAIVGELLTPRMTPDDIKEPLPTSSSRRPTLKILKKALSLDADAGMASSQERRSNNRSSSLSNPRASIRERYFLKKLRNELKMSCDNPDEDVDTDVYMYGAVYACTGMLLWKHKWILIILTVPIIWYVIKQIGKYFSFWDYINNQRNKLIEVFKNWYKERQQALIPAHVRGLYKIYVILDKKIKEVLKASIDSVATIVVILALLIFTFSASIFVLVQIYSEGIHLIQVTGEILNSTLVNNPDIDWLPKQWEESVNSVLDNAYTYGRSAIADGVKKLVKDLEPSKAELLEKKVLELWDRLYQAWMMSDEPADMIGPTVDVAAALSVWESFRESFGKVPTQMFNMSGISNFAKDNVGIFVSVLDSIWSIVKGNISIVLSVFTELLSLVLISGSAVLNFALSTIVFFTTLFYLLSSSGKTYKPIELIAMFSPISLYRKDDLGGFAIALQEAVIGVFTATFKLASFFGMWTWFIHNLFQVKIVYLPSAFATVLAAVPFLDAYFACIPATIELWFTRGRVMAILFFTFHFLPCNIVITNFYKEIKGGGHPYLTGLSIAGGILYLGVEGAIFGPLLLCCIMVAINLSRRYIQSFSEDALNSLKSQINQMEVEQATSP